MTTITSQISASSTTSTYPEAVTMPAINPVIAACTTPSDKPDVSEAAPTPAPKPSETATVFAKLYHQWFDQACDLSAEARSQTEPLVDSYIADILALWDEGTKSWLPESPTILRLESHDIAVFTMRKPHIAIHVGCIETDAALAFFGPKNPSPDTESMPQGLRWKSLRPCAYAIGKKVRGFRLSENKKRLLVAFEAFLGDGGLLRIDYTGVSATNHATRHDAPYAAQYGEVYTSTYVTRYSSLVEKCFESTAASPVALAV